MAESGDGVLLKMKFFVYHSLSTHSNRGFLRGFYMFQDVLSALIALRTAITITPTSAKIAAHIFAIPSALKSRQRNLIPSAKTIF